MNIRNTRVLFSSDLHGKTSAFEDFAHLLSKSRYSFGILGGDLHDEWIPDETAIALTGCDPDDFLDEIGSSEDDPVALWQRSKARELQDTAIGVRIDRLQEILGKSKKQIYFVLGNHDRIVWQDNEHMTNLHLKRVEYQDWNLVGYRWTDMDRTTEELLSDLENLNQLIDESTILISHSPAKGTLDGLSEWGTGYGIEVLNQIKCSPWLHLVGHVHSLAGQKGHSVNGCWPNVRKFFEIDVRNRVSSPV